VEAGFCQLAYRAILLKTNALSEDPWTDPYKKTYLASKVEGF